MQGEYNFWAISAVIIISYWLSVLIVRKGGMTQFMHRQLWNVVLLLSFILSGPLGFLLSFLIDGGIRTAYYGSILWLHVEAGIVMTIVSVLHILWHWQYFHRIGKTLRRRP